MSGRVTPDRMIAALAGAQAGVVSRHQLATLGIGHDAIDRRIRCGRLHVVFRGVFAVGHRALPREGMWWAGLLACGNQAALSHASAAAAWDLLRRGGRIHVTVADRRRVRHPGLTVHRPRASVEEDFATCRGLVVTSPARTLVDLAATGLRGRALESALDRAQLLRLLDVAAVQAVLDRRPRPRGSDAVADVLARYVAGTVVTRSELEERFLSLCDRFELPRPRVNTRIERFEADFVWPRERLVVEVDGYAWHRSPTMFTADRERDVELVLAGYRVLRFTWAQVTRRPAYVARAVSRALGVD